jgi:hypothetical protein
MRKKQSFALPALVLVLGAALTAACTSTPGASTAMSGGSERIGAYESERNGANGFDRDVGLQPRNSNPYTAP